MLLYFYVFIVSFETVFKKKNLLCDFTRIPTTYYNRYIFKTNRIISTLYANNIQVIPFIYKQRLNYGWYNNVCIILYVFYISTFILYCILDIIDLSVIIYCDNTSKLSDNLYRCKTYSEFNKNCIEDVFKYCILQESVSTLYFIIHEIQMHTRILY